MCVLRVCTSAPRKLWNQKAGANRNACVHFACVRFACVYLCAAKLVESAGRHVHFACVRFACVFLCAAKVVGSGGGRRPERLCAFCVCAFCVCIPERLCACCVCAFFPIATRCWVPISLLRPLC